MCLIQTAFKAPFYFVREKTRFVLEDVKLDFACARLAYNSPKFD